MKDKKAIILFIIITFALSGICYYIRIAGGDAAAGMTAILWHFPLMIAGVYMPGTPLWYQLPIFTIEIIAITAIMAIIRLKAKSVWPAIILHASHNYFDQVIFSPLTKGEKSTYFVGETGVITVVIIVPVALFVIRKRNFADKNNTIAQ